MVHKIKTKWIRTDPWRGYEQPVYAIAGVSDTGMFEDSPAPTDEVTKELLKLKSYLERKGIKTNIYITKSSNVFMRKRWLVTKPKDYKKAKKLANKWIKRMCRRTRYIHYAD